MTMDHAAVAKRIRAAIFDKAEEEGRVMHADSVDSVIETILRDVAPTTQPYGYGIVAATAGQEPKEWR